MQISSAMMHISRHTRKPHTGNKDEHVLALFLLGAHLNYDTITLGYFSDSLSGAYSNDIDVAIIQKHQAPWICSKIVPSFLWIRMTINDTSVKVVSFGRKFRPKRVTIREKSTLRHFCASFYCSMINIFVTNLAILIEGIVNHCKLRATNSGR